MSEQRARRLPSRRARPEARSTGRRRGSTKTSSTRPARASPRSRSTAPKCATPSARDVFELQDAFDRAREDPEVGVDHPHRRGRQGLLLGRRPAHPRRRRLRRQVDGVPPAQRARPAAADPPLPKPVIAMVAGYAIGGGHVLHVVLRPDHRRRQRASSARPARRSAASTAATAPGCWPRTVGLKKAREIWYLCRQYDAQTALDMGLVNAVVPLARLEEETVSWAREMLEKSPAGPALAQGRASTRRPTAPPGCSSSPETPPCSTT